MKRATEAALEAALNIRNLYCNPDLLDQAAEEIDCGGIYGGCIWCKVEDQTNVNSCKQSDGGEYCPNDVAETLREVARVSRRPATEADA
jgi:hypothetical protein